MFSLLKRKAMLPVCYFHDVS